MAYVGIALRKPGVSFSSDSSELVEVVTDADGHYVLDDVFPGRYTVTAPSLRREVEVSVVAGQSARADIAAPSLSIAPAALSDPHLKPSAASGVIRGRLLNNAGQPMPRRTVVAEPKDGNGTRGAAVTDDRGEFAIRLVAGSYRVAVRPQSSSQTGREAIQDTYFPGTLNMEEATPVSVVDGVVVDGVDFIMIPPSLDESAENPAPSINDDRSPSRGAVPSRSAGPK